MRRFITFISLLSVFTAFLYADDINVAPGENTLVNAVAAANPGDVFILERGENKYYYSTEMVDALVPVTIKSEGDGDLPIFFQIANETGGYNGTDIRAQADIIIQGIAFSAIRTAGDRFARTGTAIAAGRDSIRMVVEECTFVGYGGRTLQPNAEHGTLIVRNCVETGNGRVNRADNGRFMDIREKGLDTLIIQNNTLLNCADRWIRHMGEPLGTLGYVLVDHNTFMNGTGYRPNFQFRKVRELYFTNNIIINPAMLGTTTSGVRLDEIEYTDPLKVCVFTITREDTNEVLVMQNNNVWIDPRITAILGDLDLANGDSVENAPLFNKAFEDRIDDKAYFQEELPFVHSVTIDSILPEIEIYAGGTLGYNHSAFQFRTDEYAIGLDMSYGTSATSYTAAAGGFPLGDLNWYPAKKQEWVNAGMPIVNSIENVNNQLPDRLSLKQNYPNPFNPNTFIEFSLPETGNVKLTIYNILGQKITTLVNKNVSAGNYRSEWNGRNSAGYTVPSGVYIYRLQTADKTEVRKMMLLK
jgi:FlgD Ig-like domain